MHRVRLILFAVAVACVAVGQLAGVRPEGGRLATLQAAQTTDVQPMAADDPATWKALVAEKDFRALLKQQQEEIAKHTKASSAFSRGLSKLNRHAYYVAVLGNVGTMIQDDPEEQKKAAALRDAGLALLQAAADKEFDAAKEAADLIASYPDKIAPAESGEPKVFSELSDLHELMEGVNSLYASATRVIKARSPAQFRRDARAASGEALMLACLSVISRDYEEAEDWKGWCDLMRAESKNMADALAKGSKEDAQTARDGAQKSCDQCHEVYREEE